MISKKIEPMNGELAAKTDYLDLWQIHEVVYEDDPDLHFAPNGATEALLEAKQQGKVRFIGFTGHKHPQIHFKMFGTRLSVRCLPDAAECLRRHISEF